MSITLKQYLDGPGYNDFHVRGWRHGDYKGLSLRLYEKEGKRLWGASCGLTAYDCGPVYDCKTKIRRQIARLQALAVTIEAFEARLDAGKKLPKRFRALEALPGDETESGGGA